MRTNQTTRILWLSNMPTILMLEGHTTPTPTDTTAALLVKTVLLETKLIPFSRHRPCSLLLLRRYQNTLALPSEWLCWCPVMQAHVEAACFSVPCCQLTVCLVIAIFMPISTGGGLPIITSRVEVTAVHNEQQR